MVCECRVDEIRYRLSESSTIRNELCISLREGQANYM
jgi:hypothetical protein